MKKILSIVLIIGGLALGYFGFTKLDDSSKGIEIGNLEIKAEDKESSTTAYIMIGAGILLVIGGVSQVGKK